MHFEYGTFTLCGVPFQAASPMHLSLFRCPYPEDMSSVWALSISLAATLEIEVSFSSFRYLDVSVPGVSFSQPIYSAVDTYALPYVGFPIRISAGRWLFAPNRSFSQLVTSFVGSQCQGIRLMLFLT